MKRISLFIFAICLLIQTSAQPPAGYYSSISNQNCEPLKTALFNIISNGYITRSYNDLWDQYKLTDIKPREVGTGSAMVIYDIYSDVPTGTDPYNYTPGVNECGNYNAEGKCYNREHSFPKSWFNDASPMYSDYIHILPTDGFVNGKRSNYRYGEVGSATWTSLNGSKVGPSSFAGISGTVFEPIDSFKGDVARIYLYMVTRYQDKLAQWNNYSTDGALTLTGNIFPAVEIPYLRLMLKWHNLDPVSQKEIVRNNGAYSFQNNRNPFVDHPEYVEMIWNANCPGLSALPVDIISFNAKLVGSKVLLKWKVENELNFDRYEIERSLNGKDFFYIGTKKANGSSGYLYEDDINELNGRALYYRIKKMDKDGKFSYTDIIRLHIPLNVKFSVYPNPAVNKVQLSFNNNISSDVIISLTDMQGRNLKTETFKAVNGMIELDVSRYPEGVYFINMETNGSRWLQKFIISR